MPCRGHQKPEDALCEEISVQETLEVDVPPVFLQDKSASVTY
jgi:hypothetical protein